MKLINEKNPVYFKKKDLDIVYKTPHFFVVIFCPDIKSLKLQAPETAFKIKFFTSSTSPTALICM